MLKVQDQDADCIACESGLCGQGAKVLTALLVKAVSMVKGYSSRLILSLGLCFRNKTWLLWPTTFPGQCGTTPSHRWNVPSWSEKLDWQKSVPKPISKKVLFKSSLRATTSENSGRIYVKVDGVGMAFWSDYVVNMFCMCSYHFVVAMRQNMNNYGIFRHFILYACHVSFQRGQKVYHRNDGVMSWRAHGWIFPKAECTEAVVFNRWKLDVWSWRAGFV